MDQPAQKRSQILAVLHGKLVVTKLQVAQQVQPTQFRG
jgi:hypothetical protein